MISASRQTRVLWLAPKQPRLEEADKPALARCLALQAQPKYAGSSVKLQLAKGWAGFPEQVPFLWGYPRPVVSIL